MVMTRSLGDAAPAGICVWQGRIKDLACPEEYDEVNQPHVLDGVGIARRGMSTTRNSVPATRWSIRSPVTTCRKRMSASPSNTQNFSALVS